VVINPFIWSRLNKEDQKIPFTFSEFQGGSKPSSMSNKEEPRQIGRIGSPTTSESTYTESDILTDLMEILKGILGPRVSDIRYQL
jgi:hypothetical protein